MTVVLAVGLFLAMSLYMLAVLLISIPVVYLLVGWAGIVERTIERVMEDNYV